MRKAALERKTNETKINMTFDLDGKGNVAIDTGIGFLNHMLELFAVHGQFDLDVVCDGDFAVDDHHSVEDIGIVLGKAFDKAIGAKKGIQRYATIFLPMDEALSTVSIDIGGRPYLVFNVNFEKEKVGQFDTELVEEFFRAFVNQAKINLHINLQYGTNTHHIIESIFKGFGRCLSQAAGKNDKVEGVLSTKGVLE